MKFGKIGVVVIGLVPFNVYGECTPTPDCASIGYTETSCETISLKCPFVQSKLYCFPCDSSYQYSCSEPNEYGDGESCNNKYKACCNTNCVVGNYYYADGSCSSCVDNSKILVGLVVKDNEIVMEMGAQYLYWADTEVDLSGLMSYASVADAKTDYNGVENTIAIVNHYGNDNNNLAAVFCYNYAPVGLESSKGKWYLPALGEVYEYLYLNYEVIVKKYGTNVSSLFWSSTEFGDRSAWRVKKTDGEVATNLKIENTFDTTCLLKI